MATPPQGRTALPPSLVANPRLGDWLRVLPDGVVEVRSGKVELGQGVITALAQVAAEELDLDVARVRMVAAVTGISPDEGYTSGSLSIQYSGAALRVACAEARPARQAGPAASFRPRHGARRDAVRPGRPASVPPRHPARRRRRTGDGAARSRDRRAGREFPGRDRRPGGGGAARRRPAPGGREVAGAAHAAR